MSFWVGINLFNQENGRFPPALRCAAGDKLLISFSLEVDSFLGFAQKIINWRREGDSNSRDPCGSTSFPTMRTRPLCDPSPYVRCGKHRTGYKLFSCVTIVLYGFFAGDCGDFFAFDRGGGA